MATMLKCLACGEIRDLHDGRNVCGCGRSSAMTDGRVIELQGPGRVLVPADDIETVRGLPWTAVPEEPLLVRREAA
ncbi:MAG TPA: hypothetical protein VE669_06395 [Actinomycetota bacterium]|jgi:hypothetical protein|nr:hypothetical protein [Actinomycetota bacterium]